MDRSSGSLQHSHLLKDSLVFEKTASERTRSSLASQRVNPSATYFEKCRELLAVGERQQTSIQKAAEWFAEMILADRMVHLRVRLVLPSRIVTGS